MYRYFKKVARVVSGNYIYIFGSLKDCLMKGLNSITSSNYSITPELSHYRTKA